QPPIERVFVVLGHEAERITPVIDRAGAEVLVNELYKRGRASSLRAGARAVADDTRTILVLDVDQPRPRRVIQRLIENHVRASNVITVPTCEGKRGHPTVVDGWLLPELRRVRERTEGLRGFLEQHEADARVGDHTLRLRPYETVRIEKGVVHSVRTLRGEALVLSLSIPPLDPDDQHPAE